MSNYALMRIVENIMKIKFPEKENFLEDDIKSIISEFIENGSKYGTEEEEYTKALSKSDVIKKNLTRFVEYLLYRNISNFDSMILLSAMKGTGKSSAAIMIGKAWCELIGIKFDPGRHICYSNAQVSDKIDKLNKFEPLIADESINFACLNKDAKILLGNGKEVPIEDLVNERDFDVWTFNTYTKKREIKKAFGCRKIRKEEVYKVKLSSGEYVTCTLNHKFLIRKGMQYKELKDVIWGNMIKQAKSNRWRRKRKVGYGYKKTPDYDDCMMTFKETYYTPREYGGLPTKPYIRSIEYKGIEDVYEILGVKDNGNYVANNIICKNSSEDWAKAENKELKKKLGKVRTKHLLFILCFPLKINKVDKVYLENYVNMWIDLFGRGIGALYVKDNNPAHDSWRVKEFAKLGAYTEFTHPERIKNILSRHPNFWSILKFPKPGEKIYNEYLRVREQNVYDDPTVMSTVVKEDIIRSILIVTLKELITRDSSLSVNRLLTHLENRYDMKIEKSLFEAIMRDANMLVKKMEDNKLLIEGKK